MCAPNLTAPLLCLRVEDSRIGLFMYRVTLIHTDIPAPLSDSRGVKPLPYGGSMTEPLYGP
ncbi:hypothetical protein D3C81_338320 [compost metagenome]